jgi:HEAT repeat protein
MIRKHRFFTWCLFLITFTVSVVGVAQDRSAGGVAERELIGVLQADSAKAEKAITCKRLAIYGTEECVPALAPLLADEELASWARIALEAIPGPAADAALRDALDKLEGRLLVGTINSIGVRRDAQAVEGLIRKLDDANADVASAAAVALGHVGGEKAAAALEQALAKAPAGVRSAAAEGCILCAESYHAQDKRAEATRLYDAVREANVPDQRHLEAVRGAILARGSAGIPLLIEQLRSENKSRVGIGLRTARELPGRDVTEALAAELDRLDPDQRPLLLLALADRNDAAVRPTVLEAAQSGPKGLRLTAIQILIRLGDVSCVPVLLEIAMAGDADLEAAAMETVIRLPGKDVDADLLARLPAARGKQRRILIEIAGQRQIGEALPAVAASLQDSDAEVRRAAIQTVGIIGQAEQATDLVQLIQKTDDRRERSDIEKALLAISGRGGAACIPHLRPLTRSQDDQLHKIGLHALAIIGGPDALAAVTTAIGDAEPTVRDEAVRILSTWPNNWPDDAEAGQALLALVTSGQKTSHQVLGLRGYLQYIRGNKGLSSEQKVAKIKGLQPHIKRPEEKRLAIAVLGEAPCAGALEMLTAYAQTPAIAEEAYSAMAQVAGRGGPGISKDERRKVLQMVAEKSGNNRTKRAARQALSRVN